MLDKCLIEHCAPTLASIKTANLFSVDANDRDLDEHFDKWKKQLSEKGVSMMTLHCSDKRVLVYVYRPERLKKDLQRKEVSEFLKAYGYEQKSVTSDIEHLKSRLGREDEFPHEIGLFLGYPLGDVTGFIKNGGRNSKCGGYWQVYCNERETEKLFDSFSKCKEIYVKMFNQGKTISQLTVAV